MASALDYDVFDDSTDIDNFLDWDGLAGGSTIVLISAILVAHFAITKFAESTLLKINFFLKLNSVDLVNLQYAFV